jgi:hypothetical protein
VAPLQPAHDDARKARLPSIRITLAPIDMGTARQIRRIGPRQQPLERLYARQVDGLHHMSYSNHHSADVTDDVLAVAFYSGCVALDLAGPARQSVGDIVSDALTFPGEPVDRFTDTGAGPLICVRSAFAKTLRRIGHSLADL